jgi:SAM-dependent methyltransferase
VNRVARPAWPAGPAGAHADVSASAPYSAFARVYDGVLGARFFPRLKRVFEALVRRYCIGFTSAADVACGTGFFVRYLRDRGVPLVFGVDRSPAMLRVAAARNRGNGARFLLQDLSSLQLPRRVDLITSTFDSLNYLLTRAELLRAFSRFRRALRPRGHLIFDMITDLPFHRGGTPRLERVRVGPTTFVRATRRDARRLLQMAFVNISRGGQTHREIHVQRGYPVRTVAELLAIAGFDVLGIHDFDTLMAPDSSTKRVVYIASARPQALSRRPGVAPHFARLPGATR